MEIFSNQLSPLIPVGAVVALAGIVTAFVGRGVLVFIVAMLLAYAVFIAHVGGFGRMDNFLAAFGFGLFVMVPAGVVCAIVVVLAQAFHGRRKLRSSSETLPK